MLAFAPLAILVMAIGASILLRPYWWHQFTAFRGKPKGRSALHWLGHDPFDDPGFIAYLRFGGACFLIVGTLLLLAALMYP